MLATGTPNEDRVSERSKFSLVSKAAGGKIRRWLRGTSLVVQWLRLHVPYAKGLGLIPHQGTRSHRLQLRVFLPQLKIPRVATKTWCSQINKNKPTKKALLTPCPLRLLFHFILPFIAKFLEAALYIPYLKFISSFFSLN